MALLSQVASETLLQTVPVWGFWVIALLVCGHAVWVGLCAIFGIRWPGILSTSICCLLTWAGLALLWNQAPLDEVVSSQPTITWLSIGSPAELKIAICFHADRLASGILLWLLPMIAMAWIRVRRPSDSHLGFMTGILAAVSLMLIFLLAFAGDAWVFLVVWMLMAVLSGGLLWINETKPRPRDLVKFMIPMLITDLGMLLAISVIGSGLSSTKLAVTLHRDSLRTIFQDNPAALDTAALGIWLAVCGRLLLPLVSLGNDLMRGRGATTLALFHLLFGVGPACLLLLKLHHVIWNATIIDSLILMTLVIGALSAFIAACSNQRDTSLGWSFSWAGSLVIAGMMSGVKTGLTSGMFVFANWMTLLLVTSWYIRTIPNRQTMTYLPTWAILILAALSVCGPMGLLHEFSSHGHLGPVIVIVLGQGLAIFAWTKSLLAIPLRSAMTSQLTPRFSVTIQLLTIVWAMGIGLIIHQRAWWSSPDGLRLLTEAFGWHGLVGAYQQAGVYSPWGLVSAIVGMMGIIIGVLVCRVPKLRSWSERLADSSLIVMGRQAFYSSEAIFGVSLFIRGSAQLTRMFDWIIAGFLTGRAPQKLTINIQQELSLLTTHPIPWMIMIWMFATTIMLVIFLQSN